jgi:hypothetical protein
VRSEVTRTADLAATSPSPDDVMSGYRQLLATLTDAQRVPAIHAVLAAGVFDTADHPDKEFIFGLERILDGIEALIRVAK